MSREEHRRYEAKLAELRAARPKEPTPMQFSSKEIALIVIATVLAIAGLFVEDLRIVFSCLVVSWAAFLYLCITHLGSRTWRSSFAIIITTVYMLVMFHVHARKLEREQEDTAQNLSATVELPSPDPFLSLFKVVNGGKTGLVHHKIWCSINHALIGRSHLSHVSTGYDTGLSDVLIHPGGDSEIKACLAIAPRMGVLSCADVSLFYHYSLESQPDIDSKKEFRFIGGFWGGKDFHWSSLTLDAPIKC